MHGSNKGSKLNMKESEPGFSVETEYSYISTDAYGLGGRLWKPMAYVKDALYVLF